MRHFVGTAAALLALTLATAPLAAQAPAAAACDPTGSVKGDLAKAQLLMTRAIQASDAKASPSKDLYEVLRLTENGTDNPTARSYLRGEAYVLLLSQPSAAPVMVRSAIGYKANPTATIDLFAAADSSFTVVEMAMPECKALLTQWRQQRPWLSTLNASIAALNANKLDSAEILAKRSLLMDRHAPYAYSVLGSIAVARKNIPAAEQYWKQTLDVAGTDTAYADVRVKTMYDVASTLTARAEAASAAEKRAAARVTIKPWQDYLAVATNEILIADAVDNLSRMYVSAGDSASMATIYAPFLASPSKFGEIPLLHAGVVATKANRHADAAQLFAAALERNPYSRDALNNLAATYIQTKEYSKAFPIIDRLSTIDPSNPDNPLLYAFAYQGMYKNTKDKKLQKMYTDSLVYFNDKSEKAPVKVTVSQFSRSATETVVGGTIENLTATPKTYALSVELLDKSGNVVATEAVKVGPVAPKAKQRFTFTTAKGGVYGMRYKPIT